MVIAAMNLGGCLPPAYLTPGRTSGRFSRQSFIQSAPGGVTGPRPLPYSSVEVIAMRRSSRTQDESYAKPSTQPRKTMKASRNVSALFAVLALTIACGGRAPTPPAPLAMPAASPSQTAEAEIRTVDDGDRAALTKPSGVSQSSNPGSDSVGSVSGDTTASPKARADLPAWVASTPGTSATVVARRTQTEVAPVAQREARRRQATRGGGGPLLYYRVARNDNLSTIASRLRTAGLHVTARQLAQWNADRIQNARHIRPGQVLRIHLRPSARPRTLTAADLDRLALEEADRGTH